MKCNFISNPVILSVIIIGLYISKTETQKIEFDPTCPVNVTAMEGFNESKFIGKWYQIGGYVTWYDLAGHCNTKQIIGSNGTLKAELVSYNIINHNIPFTIAVDLSSKGNLSTAAYAAYVSLAQFIVPIKFDYMVLDTNYSGYAVTYACISLMKFMRLRFAWIYSRNKFSLGTEFNAGLDILDKKGVNRTGVFPTDQLLCPKYH